MTLIPKRLHQIWLGSDLPDEFQRYAEVWQELHPAWEYTLWTEANLPPLRNKGIYDNAESLTAGNPWQFRSDLVRYELLYLHGGLYCDTDFEPLKPIDPLIPADATCIAAWEEPGRWVANGLMGATQGHWFLDLLITELPKSVEANRKHRANRATGPQFLTRMHERHQGLDHIIDRRAVLPYSYQDLRKFGRERPRDFPDATLVHHWRNARSRQGLL